MATKTAKKTTKKRKAAPKLAATRTKTTTPSPPRTTIKLFVSYAHDDRDFVDKLLADLGKQLKPSLRFEFELWRDQDEIVLGTQWRKEITRALKRCGTGLLLLSPAFLGSDFIGTTEIPALRARGLPVMLRRVNTKLQNLRGLEKIQYFELQPKRGDRRSYEECTPSQRQAFVQQLHMQIERRLSTP